MDPISNFSKLVQAISPKDKVGFEKQNWIGCSDQSPIMLLGKAYNIWMYTACAHYVTS